MSNTVFFWTLGVHILICAIAYVLLWRGILHLPRACIFIVVAVPGFGLVSLIGSALALQKPITGTYRTSNQDDRQYKTTAEGDDDGTDLVVPLEEALLVSDVNERRSIMMDVLRGEPSRYIDQLKMACLNSDMEVTHYATTTIMELQRDFDLFAQHLENACEEIHANADMLEEAIEQIQRYLSSGLLDGFSLQRMRQRYHELLLLKAQQQPGDIQTLLAILYNKINMEDVAGAEEEMDVILKRWPTVEEAWLLALRLAVEQHDRRLLDQRIHQMRQAPVHWSIEGKDIMQFWLTGSQEREPDNGSGLTVMFP